MAEGEPNLSVQLFVELKERFPQTSELRLQNMIKQFANNRDKCLETLNKEYSNMSSPPSHPSHPNNNHHHQVSNSWMNYNMDTPAASSSTSSYTSNAHKPWSPQKQNVNISESPKPNLNPDFGPFIKTSATDSSTIPNIKCQSSPPVQIAVHHITTSKPDSQNTHVFCKSPTSSSSASPNNTNQWGWPLNQPKIHEVHITPTPSPASTQQQHSAKANIFIDPPNRNMSNHQTVINQSGGSTCVISPNPRLQPSLVRPSQLITIHSPQPGSSQTGGMYSPQPGGYSGHGVLDTMMSSNSPNPAGWMPEFSIPVQVQTTTTSPSTLHHVSSTYQTVAMPPPPSQQNSSTTSAIIHYPAIHVNNSAGLTGNCSPSESMKNRTANHMSILQTVGGSPHDSVQMPRARNGSLQEDPDYTNALITHQRLRYDKLKDDYQDLVAQCQELNEEIKKLDTDKKKCYSKRSFPTESDVSKLRIATESLRMEIDNMTVELDAHNNGLTPIGVLDPLEQQHFYKHMNTGQSGSIFATPQSPLFSVKRRDCFDSTTNSLLKKVPNPPPRPPRYQESHPVPPPLPVDEEAVEETWNCSECTYMNHQALDKCEMCEIPRKHKAN